MTIKGCFVSSVSQLGGAPAAARLAGADRIWAADRSGPARHLDDFRDELCQGIAAKALAINSVRQYMPLLLKLSLLLYPIVVEKWRTDALLIAVQNPVSECCILKLITTNLNASQDILVC